MSTAAIPYYNLFIARGMNENDARENAEAVAALKSEEVKAAALQAAKAHAEAEAAKAVATAVAKSAEQTQQTVADSEEKAKTQFVTKAEYHERGKALATRADTAELRGEMNNGFTQLRGEMNDGFIQLRGEMNDGFAQLRGEMNERFAAMTRRMDGLYRIAFAMLFAVMAACAAIVVGVVKFVFFGI